eukprot:524378-Hanusia_phi.AAC.19
MAQAACSKDAQIQILRPTSGDVVFDPAPELELSAVVRDDETDEGPASYSLVSLTYSTQIATRSE